MNLRRLRHYVDIVFKAISIVAILAGGVWAYYLFSVTRTSVANVDIFVSAESLRYSNDLRLLLVHAKPKNVGQTVVSLPKKGFIVTVKVVPPNVPVGAVELDKLPEFYKTDILDRFPDGYEIEPGAEYDELVALVVPKGAIFSVKAEMALPDNTEVDNSIVAKSLD